MITEYLLKNSASIKNLKTMNVTLKKLVVMLTTAVILLSFTDPNIKIAFSGDIGGKIDLFTQKGPYSGKGPNVPSDAFGLGEVVKLYALVINDWVPLQNLLVSFYVQSPDNTSFSLVAGTNASGIAVINFTIPQKCVNESEVFGEWFALAHVLIEGHVFQDTLTFNVDWIIKLISVRTIDENLTYRASFGIGGEVGLEVTLRSIAVCMKNTTLAMVILDELNVPISYLEIRDFDVQPNGKLVFLYCKLYIAKWAFIGKATVFISALTAPANQSGVPYCPAISAQFFITPFEPITIVFHDAAVVNVVPSATSIELGQPLSVNVVVRNEGTEVEDFNVTAYFDDALIGTLNVTTLSPCSRTSLNFTLDTSSIDAGNYTIRVSIAHLINEADITDNVLIDGVVEIKPKLPTIIHNIAIVDVNTSNDSVYMGDLLQINVSVVNKGTETETFDVMTYYDLSLIETLRVSALTPNAQVALTSVWNTSFVHEGFYQIKASAPLSDDIDVSDNTFIDGVVKVEAKPTPPPFKIHDVAVSNVTPSCTLIYIDETVDIYVVAENQGNYTESFNVTVFYDSNVLGTLLVKNLESNSEKTLVFHWNTEDVLEGNYTLRASASFIPNEVDFGNNFYDDGVVEVRTGPHPPLLVHDVAILTVYPYPNLTHIGGVLEIFVVVKNRGDFVESFNVTVFYDFYAIETLFVENLEPNSKKTSVFQWNTKNVPEGNYTLSARASQVLGEENLKDNLYEDGVVEVVAAPMGWFGLSWFYWLLLLLLVLVVILLIALYYRRKRRERAEESFHSGWTAWYYGYDMRKRRSASKI